MASPFIRIKLDDSEAMRKMRAAMLKSPKVMAMAMYTEGIKLLVPAARQKLRENKSVWRGEVHQRVGIRVAVDKLGPAIDFGAPGVPHAYALEKGQPPHSEELEKIKEYLSAKQGLVEPGLSRVAAAVVRTLETVGSKPHPFIKPAWEATKHAYTKAVFVRFKLLMGIM